MTASSAFGNDSVRASSRRARAHGLDRLVMKLSMAMLLWARRRADRRVLSRESHALLLAQSIALERRSHADALRATRVR